MDWRTGAAGSANKDFSRSLFRPQLPGNNSLDTVEEILWLPGCEALAPQRLSACFTVQMIDGSINLNVASPDVLVALGLSAAQAQQVVDARAGQPFRDLQDLGNVVDVSQNPELQSRLSFQSSVFYTIFSSGMVDYNRSRHIIKAIVRLDLDKPDPWSILYWAEDYPSE
jgi:type II secretory pathway component PulK